MLRFIFKLVVWVTLARWMYAEAQLVTPSAVPYINSAMQSIQIPTHDKWNDSVVGHYLKKQLPDTGSLRRQMTANIELPIKNSAGILEQASDALSLSGNQSGFEKF